MRTVGLHGLLGFIAGVQPAMAVFWLGLAVFTVGLGVLLYTRWGQYRSLHKCMALSLLAHLLLACYAATLQIVATPPRTAEPVIRVALSDDTPDANPGTQAATDDHDAVFAEPKEELAKSPFENIGILREQTNKEDRHSCLSQASDKEDRHSCLSQASDKEDRHSCLSHETDKNVCPPNATDKNARLLDANPLRSDDAAREHPLRDDSPVAMTPEPKIAQDAAVSIDRPLSAPPSAPASASSNGNSSPPVRQVALPEAYRLRVVPDHSEAARRHGGTTETEAAVKAALRWLANHQSPDGHWDPAAYGAGVETRVQGRDRQGAGGSADTGITGLALLAFLASGHTHSDGQYAPDVRRGLEYLVSIQGPDGNLGGRAAMFEFMYSHAMAACALSEAYGMTRDPRLRDPVRRAVHYTLRAQDPIGGGWRYRPGDAGDTSQLGWQLMVLKSAELAGIATPELTRERALRFLRSVSSGQYGGRASYRPGEQVSRSMTAEALFCRQVLGLPRQHPAANEAAEELLRELPSVGTYNLYYWYYGTLSLYQLQDEHWQRWNDAMRAAVLARQVKDGPQAGSWGTGDLWGAAGGRVFTTALATLTLEVYYRFLPLYGRD